MLCSRLALAIRMKKWSTTAARFFTAKTSGEKLLCLRNERNQASSGRILYFHPVPQRDSMAAARVPCKHSVIHVSVGAYWPPHCQRAAPLFRILASISATQNLQPQQESLETSPPFLVRITFASWSNCGLVPVRRMTIFQIK